MRRNKPVTCYKDLDNQQMIDNDCTFRWFAFPCLTNISNNKTLQWHLGRLMTKPRKWHVRPAKTQISLCMRPVWSESSVCAQWVAEDPILLHADSEDSDQTGRIRLGGCPGWFESLLGAHAILLVLSWGGSFILNGIASEWLKGFHWKHVDIT